MHHQNPCPQKKLRIREGVRVSWVSCQCCSSLIFRVHEAAPETLCVSQCCNACKGSLGSNEERSWNFTPGREAPSGKANNKQYSFFIIIKKKNYFFIIINLDAAVREREEPVLELGL